jgi:predicted dinucleotide-binding enzyme
MSTKKVAVLGSGDVGRVLASAFTTLEHEVMLGARDLASPKIGEWQAASPGGQVGSYSDAVTFGDIIVLATPGMATEDVLRSVGTRLFDGKTVIDATNPLDHKPNALPTMAIGLDDSLGERIQRLIEGAHVVKAFNTVGNALMYRPHFEEGRPDMFICGNDAGAKTEVSALLDDFGWGVIDVGGIESSRYLEPMCMVWVLHGVHSGQWHHAFKMLHR